MARTQEVRGKNKVNKNKGRGPKSYKADGSAKKRWSAAERSAKGMAPRRSGGRSAQERNEGRPQRWGVDGAVSEGGNSNDRRQDRDSRGNNNRGGDRFERRDDRSNNRDDRGGYQGRSDRGGYQGRNDRGGYQGRDNNRFDRRDDRRNDNRGDRFDGRNDRRGGDRFERRDDRSYNRDDRGGYQGRNDNRGDRSYNRDDRGGYQGRNDRGGYQGRNDRGGYQGRDNNRFDRRDDRRNDNRGRFNDNRGRFNDDRGHFDADDHDAGNDFMEWSPETAAPSHSVNPASTTATTDVTFAELGVPAALVGELAERGIEHPFPIQAATIPDALSGRDVLGRGRTGSGKTLGFGLPLVARLAEDDAAGHHRGRAPRGLIVVPTRELALQVADVVAPLARAVHLDVVLVAGGMAYGPQNKAFSQGVDIVVATPGRLIDLMNQGAADLTGVQITVLDEADHMADLGFLPDVTTLLDAVQPGGQRLLFSATLDRGVDKIVEKYLTDPLTHEVDSAQASVTTMEHQILHVLPHDKNATTAAVANREGRSVLFVRTQRGADRIADQLREAGVMAGALHGGLTQGARARVLEAFKEGKVPVLVATDVAARGIHVDDVSLVLQVDPPMSHKDYLHRAGRTARAGSKGVVATVILPHQRKQMDRLMHQAGIKVKPVRLAPQDEQLAEITGARTPSGDPIAEADYQALIAPRKPARRPGGPGRGGYRGGPRGRSDRGGYKGGGYKGKGGGYKGGHKGGGHQGRSRQDSGRAGSGRGQY